MAQNTEDSEVWIEGKVQFKFNPKLKFSIAEQIRFDDGGTGFERHLTQLKLDRELFENFELGIGYRFYGKEKNYSSIHLGNRWHTELNYKYRIDRVDFKFRLRYQYDYYFDKPDQSEQDLRYKFGIKYHIPNWELDPEMSIEYNQEVASFILKDLDRIRIMFGTDYKLTDFHEVAISVGGQKTLNSSYSKSTWIISFGYKYNL